MLDKLKILLISAVALTIAGCNSEYWAERDLYRVSKESSSILQNPHLSPPGEFDMVLDAYKKIIKKYPDTYSAKNAKIGMGILHMAREDYAKARKEFNELLAKENENSNIGFMAQNYIAMSYVKEKNWENAIKSMEKLIMDYPMARNLGQSIRLIVDIAEKRLNKPDIAVEIIERFLEKYPQHPLKDNLPQVLKRN